MIKYLVALGSRQIIVKSSIPLTHEQVIGYADHKAKRAGCPSCAKSKNIINNLGTATCGGPYTLNSTHTLTGSITTAGTAPYTYTWIITPPTGSAQTLTGAVQTYTFTQAGTYTIDLTARDSCPAGSMTDSATCSVTVTAGCIDPSCRIILT